MSDFLSKILEAKRAETAAWAARRPLSALRRDAEAMPPPRPFAEALAPSTPLPGTAGVPPASLAGRRPALPGKTPDAPPAPTAPPRVRLIAEIKRASPSKGPIRPDLDPSAYAQAYARGGAAALSVLTDGPFFGGSLDDLIAARNAVSLPVLRKDFLVSDYQILEARAAGADAVLLIVRAVSPGFLRDALALCDALGLAALVEVHDEAELETALACGARIVGVNNRNLKSFETSLETSVRLRSLIPEDRIMVAESGIRGRTDVERLVSAGIVNFLVGESLVRAPDPESAVRALVHGTNDTARPGPDGPGRPGTPSPSPHQGRGAG